MCHHLLGTRVDEVGERHTDGGEATQEPCNAGDDCALDKELVHVLHPFLY